MDGDFIQKAQKTREETFKSQVLKIKKHIQEAIEECVCTTNVSFQLQDNVEELLKRQRYKVTFFDKTWKDENGNPFILIFTEISWKNAPKGDVEVVCETENKDIKESSVNVSVLLQNLIDGGMPSKEATDIVLEIWANKFK